MCGSSGGFFAAQPLHGQTDGFILTGFRWRTAVKRHVAPDHQADQLLYVRFSATAPVPVKNGHPENGETVAKLENFMQAVRHINNAHPAVLSSAPHGAGTYFAVAQRGGRFIHDDQPGVEGQRSRDLDHLLLGHAQAEQRVVGATFSCR